jgi:hypothetical protein
VLLQMNDRELVKLCLLLDLSRVCGRTITVTPFDRSIADVVAAAEKKQVMAKERSCCLCSKETGNGEGT